MQWRKASSVNPQITRIEGCLCSTGHKPLALSVRPSQSGGPHSYCPKRPRLYEFRVRAREITVPIASEIDKVLDIMCIVK